jgi:hypothetical protein
MTVKIGHARLDENNHAKGGKAGDQTGKEIMLQDWYQKTEGWTEVFRAWDSQVAEKIASTMEQACANKNIGYDQGQRTTLYEKAKALNWNISKVTEKCECDCSSLVAVCVNAAGVAVSKDMYTGNQKTVLRDTGKFEVLTDTKYLLKSDHLRRGDILLGPGHTAIVISGGLSKIKIEKAKSFSKALTGTYTVVASKLNVRAGAGTCKKILTTLPKGTKVNCYGYYTQALDTDWLYVRFTYQGLTYTGFISSKYLKK